MSFPKWNMFSSIYKKQSIDVKCNGINIRIYKKNAGNEAKASSRGDKVLSSKKKRIINTVSIICIFSVTFV